MVKEAGPITLFFSTSTTGFYSIVINLAALALMIFGLPYTLVSLFKEIDLSISEDFGKIILILLFLGIWRLHDKFDFLGIAKRSKEKKQAIERVTIGKDFIEFHGAYAEFVHRYPRSAIRLSPKILPAKIGRPSHYIKVRSAQANNTPQTATEFFTGYSREELDHFFAAYEAAPTASPQDTPSASTPAPSTPGPSTPEASIHGASIPNASTPNTSTSGTSISDPSTSGIPSPAASDHSRSAEKLISIPTRRGGTIEAPPATIPTAQQKSERPAAQPQKPDSQKDATSKDATPKDTTITEQSIDIPLSVFSPLNIMILFAINIPFWVLTLDSIPEITSSPGIPLVSLFFTAGLIYVIYLSLTEPQSLRIRDTCLEVVYRNEKITKYPYDTYHFTQVWRGYPEPSYYINILCKGKTITRVTLDGDLDDKSITEKAYVLLKAAQKSYLRGRKKDLLPKDVANPVQIPPLSAVQQAEFDAQEHIPLPIASKNAPLRIALLLVTATGSILLAMDGYAPFATGFVGLFLLFLAYILFTQHRKTVKRAWITKTCLKVLSRNGKFVDYAYSTHAFRMKTTDEDHVVLLVLCKKMPVDVLTLSFHGNIDSCRVWFRELQKRRAAVRGKEKKFDE